jgi:hypothetical protein
MLAPPEVLADETSSPSAPASVVERRIQLNSSPPVTLSEFAHLRKEAFARLQKAAPGKPITMSELLSEIAKLRSECA